MANPIDIGADEATFESEQALVEHLEEKGYEVKDYGIYSKEPAD